MNGIIKKTIISVIAGVIIMWAINTDIDRGLAVVIGVGIGMIYAGFYQLIMEDEEEERE